MGGSKGVRRERRRERGREGGREGEKEEDGREGEKEGGRIEEGMVKDRHENNTIVSHLDGSRVLPSRGGRDSPSQAPAQHGGGGWPVLTLPQGHPHLHPHQHQQIYQQQKGLH